MNCPGCSTVDWFLYWLVLFAAIPSNLYVFFYAFRPWTQTPQGRALMTNAVGISIILDVIFAGIWFPTYPFRDVVRVVAFLLWTFGIVALLGSLILSDRERAYPPFTWTRKKRDKKLAGPPEPPVTP